MFYCEDCRRRRMWPESLTRSFGRCEICNQFAGCWNRALDTLPMPPANSEEMRELTGDGGAPLDRPRS